MKRSTPQDIFVFISTILLLTACKSRQQYIYSTTPVEYKEFNELFLDIIESNSHFRHSLQTEHEPDFRDTSLSPNNIRIVKDNAR